MLPVYRGQRSRELKLCSERYCPTRSTTSGGSIGTLTYSQRDRCILPGKSPDHGDQLMVVDLDPKSEHHHYRNLPIGKRHILLCQERSWYGTSRSIFRGSQSFSAQLLEPSGYRICILVFSWGAYGPCSPDR